MATLGRTQRQKSLQELLKLNAHRSSSRTAQTELRKKALAGDTAAKAKTDAWNRAVSGAAGISEKDYQATAAKALAGDQAAASLTQRRDVRGLARGVSYRQGGRVFTGKGTGGLKRPVAKEKMDAGKWERMPGGGYTPADKTARRAYDKRYASTQAADKKRKQVLRDTGSAGWKRYQERQKALKPSSAATQNEPRSETRRVTGGVERLPSGDIRINGRRYRARRNP